MKHFILISLFTLTSLFAQANELLQQTNNKNFFIENKGQWLQEVKYLAKIGDVNAWITDFGVVYDYYKITQNYTEEEIGEMPEYEKDDYRKENASVKGHVVKSIFNNNNFSQQFVGKSIQETYYNYFLGNEKSKWASYVPLYKGVTVEELYEGIDIKYYFDKGLLRYDFIVKPRADISQINITLEGVEKYSINEDGELELQISLGKVAHKDILAYQKTTNGENQIVKTLFTQKDDGTIGFVTENYNKEKELIIDPLVYSTFIGGSGKDISSDIVIDNTGNAFIVGTTKSTDYPLSSGAYDENFNGTMDIFINKLNSEGTVLEYSTFLGGSDEDWGFDIAIDNIGNAFITGRTSSTNYPTTSGAFDESHNGAFDVFISKLNSTGTILEYSTFLGGNSSDYSGGIVINNSGEIFVAGTTCSTDYPITSDAYDVENNGCDVFVSKLNLTGTNLEYSTFIGGSNTEFCRGIAIDYLDNIFITGQTGSTDYPTTSGAFNININGDDDVFVSKLNSTGTNLEYSTFIGGNGEDWGFDIAIDNIGNAFITGRTRSTDYPITSGAYDNSLIGGYDAFVTKLNKSGSALEYSTFIGESGGQWGDDIAIDYNGNAFITGQTNSPDYPVTSGAYDETFNADFGSIDAFMSKLNSSGTNLEYSTFIGGSSGDQGLGVTIDNTGNVFVTGRTKSTNYPVTVGAFDESHNGDEDVFVTKLHIPGSNLFTGNLTFYNNQGGTFPLVETELGVYNPTAVKVCADGSNATDIVLSLTDGNPANFDIVIKEDPNSTDYFHYGSIEYLSSTSNTATFRYTHPQVVDSDGLYREIHLQVVNTANYNDVIHTHPLHIYRAPVLMVHGLWGKKPDAFSQMNHDLIENNWHPFLTSIWNYPDDRSFLENQSVVDDGIQTLLGRAINLGFSAGKVNVVAHSMGGILTRLYIQQEYFRDDICRFITLNTPHSGSQVANFLMMPLNPIPGWMDILAGNDCFNGAVEDLQVDSDAIIKLLNGTNLNYNKVPSRVFLSTANIDDLIGANASWLQILINLITLNHNLVIDAIFNFDTNDLIVSSTSQKGGIPLSATTIIEDQIHTGSFNNNEIIANVIYYLDSKIDQNEGNFTMAGFEPAVLTYHYPILQKTTPYINQLVDGSVTITAPTDGSSYSSGETINISAIGNDNVNTLFFVANEPSLAPYFKIEETNNFTFQYEIPNNAINDIKLSVLGFGDEGFIGMDTIFVHVNVSASIDSIVATPEILYIHKGSDALISVNGYFNDGQTRNLGNNSEVVYTTENNGIAIFNSQGIITGVSADTTEGIINYKNKSAIVKIIVLPGDFYVSVDDNNHRNIKTIPEKMLLYQNHPNPFNPSTIISYSIPKVSVVSITVFDVLGREIKKLIDKEEITAGTHSISFDASHLPSGIYFYRMISENYQETKKMLLLR